MHGQVQSTADHHLADGISEVRRIASTLEPSESIPDQACQLFQRTQYDDLIGGRSIEPMAWQASTVRVVITGGRERSGCHRAGARRALPDRERVHDAKHGPRPAGPACAAECVRSAIGIGV